MPASEKASAILGKCPELLFPPAPCPRMMPVLAFDFGALTVAVYVSVLPGSEYSSIGMALLDAHLHHIHTNVVTKAKYGARKSQRWIARTRESV